MAHGVATNLTHTPPAPGQTGSCIVMVTPDAERSMSTFLGATAELDQSALHPHDIARSKVYYMEGYLAASPTGLAAALQGRDIARKAGVALAVTLSDMSMINFCRPGVEAMLGDGVDYLFCNEEEAQVWFGETDLDVVCKKIAALARVVCLTRSAKGSLVIEGESITTVAATPVKAIDSNGAGDMFAGAFLYAVTHGHSTAKAAALGNLAAAKVVSQYGCRLSQDAVEALVQQFTKM